MAEDGGGMAKDGGGWRRRGAHARRKVDEEGSEVEVLREHVADDDVRRIPWTDESLVSARRSSRLIVYHFDAHKSPELGVDSCSHACLTEVSVASVSGEEGVVRAPIMVAVPPMLEKIACEQRAHVSTACGIANTWDNKSLVRTAVGPESVSVLHMWSETCRQWSISVLHVRVGKYGTSVLHTQRAGQQGLWYLGDEVGGRVNVDKLAQLARYLA
eukprot:399818-Rhodomonas_salina.3